MDRKQLVGGKARPKVAAKDSERSGSRTTAETTRKGSKTVYSATTGAKPARVQRYSATQEPAVVNRAQTHRAATTPSQATPKLADRSEAQAEGAHIDEMRRVCFGQGKACVYMRDDAPGVVFTEWPNGVVDELRVEDDRVTRKWPDGHREQFDASAQRAHSYPHL